MLIEFITVDFEFSDERGCLKQLVHNGWNQVNFISTIAGSFRGNHYHKKNIEAFYVISGKFTLVAENLEGSVREEYVITAGDFFKIKPLIIHSFDYLENTQLISFYDKGVEIFDGCKDIWVC